jgi:hypothetical protein
VSKAELLIGNSKSIEKEFDPDAQCKFTIYTSPDNAAPVLQLN